MRTVVIVFCTLFFGFFAVGVIGANKVQGSGAKFDYKSATPEVKAEWLDEQAEFLREQLDKNLPKGRGNQAHMSAGTPQIDAEHNIIVVPVNIKGPFQMLESRSKAQTTFIEGICPEYMKTPLGKNGVVIRQIFKDDKNSTVLEFAVFPAICQQYI